MHIFWDENPGQPWVSVNGKRRLSSEAQHILVKTTASLVSQVKRGAKSSNNHRSVFVAGAFRDFIWVEFKELDVFLCCLPIAKKSAHFPSTLVKRSGKCDVGFCKCGIFLCLLPATLFIAFHPHCQAPLLFILIKLPLVVIWTQNACSWDSGHEVLQKLLGEFYNRLCQEGRGLN